MIQMAGAQIRTLLSRKRVYIIFYMVLIMVLINFFYNVTVYRGTDELFMIQPMRLLLLGGDSETCGLFFLQIYPLLVIVPAGFLYMNDEASRMQVYLISRQGRTQYIWGSALAVFVVTFMTFVLPLYLEVLLNCISFPLGAIGNTGNINTFEMYKEENSYMFAALYENHPYLYAIVFITLFGIVSGILAVFAMAISTFHIKYKVLLFLPVYVLLYGLRYVQNFIPDSMIYTAYFSYFRMHQQRCSASGYLAVILLIAFVSWRILYVRSKKDCVL